MESEIGIRPPDESNRGKLDLDVYSTHDVAERLGIHRTTVLRAIRKGKLHAKNLGGSGGMLITRENLLRWLLSDDMPQGDNVLPLGPKHSPEDS